MYLKLQKWLYWTKVANVWVGMDKIPCSGGSHMGEHGPHVNWKFLEKLFWARCPTGINKIRIPHYFQFVQQQFWVHIFVMFLSCFCNKVSFHSHPTHCVFVFDFLILWPTLKKLAFIQVFLKSCCLIFFVPMIHIEIHHHWV